MDASAAKQAIKSRRAALAKLQAENDLVKSQSDAFAEKIGELSKLLGTGQEALQFLEDVANSRRSALKAQIEAVVTEALQIVYGPELKVELTYDVKAGRSYVDVQIVKSTPAGDVKRTMEGIGGGVSDTVSVPLRLLVLLASKQTDRVCLLDEAYKHVDLERVERAAEFVAEIARRLGIQVVMCSHHEAMLDAADTVYSVSESAGKSSVKRVKGL
jgi:DNA repair exonuclease SbcCD ATPase subunit